MPKFHAVMIDETGCEFGATVEAANHSDARAKLREDYPESRIDEIRSDEEQAQRMWEFEKRRQDDRYWDDDPDWDWR